MGMVLFALGAFVLGWAVPLPLSRVLLHARGLDAGPPPHTRLVRLGCAAACALFAATAWKLLDAYCACASVLACACMLCVLVCDVHARIIPWQLAAALLGLGALRHALDGSMQTLILTLVVAGLVCALLWLAGSCRERAGKTAPLGRGDLRLMPALAACCNLSGNLQGLLACAFVMGLWGTAAAFREGRKANVPMAPGFAAWLWVGALCV